MKRSSNAKQPETADRLAGFVELPALAAHGVRAFIGGCYRRGIGSRFRAKAHAHAADRVICFLSDKWIDRPELLIHELAHILTNAGHVDKWRAKVLELGGTVQEVPGLLRSYEKRPRDGATLKPGATVERKDGTRIYKSTSGRVEKLETWRDGRAMVCIQDGTAFVWAAASVLRVVKP